MSETSELGRELRAYRRAAGLSLRGIAEEINYHPGYLSRVERGLSTPGRQLVQLYDLAVGADGALLALVPDGPRTLTTPDESRPAPAKTSMGADWRVDDREAEATTAAFRAAWEHLRAVGRELPAVFVLPSLAQHVDALSAIAVQRARPHRGLLRQAARTAEYAGWMAQESGGLAGALNWTHRAAELASRSGHRDLRAYTWVRRAELELYGGHADQAIHLSEAVRSRPDIHARVRALAAQRAAQGHALRGDASACLRGLAAAEDLWHTPDQPSLGFGPETLADPGLLVAGWCWFDLGNPARAAKTLTPAFKGLRTTQSRRLRGLFGARLARAHIAVGQIDEGLAIARRALRAAESTRSATAAGEFARLIHELRPLVSHPPARAFSIEVAKIFPGSLTDGSPG